MSDPIPLTGCHHDILGHYLKAIGILRVLARCADDEHRDPSVEGWWNPEDAIFYLRSPKYPTMEMLVEFFEQHYQPTPLFAAWNKESGLDAAGAKKLGVSAAWKLANDYSLQVVSAEDRKKPANQDKLIGSEALEAYRDVMAPRIRVALDAVTAPFIKSNSDHPLFLAKGIAGRAHLWRTHWEYLLEFEKKRAAITEARGNLDKHEGTAKARAKLEGKLETSQKGLAEMFPFSTQSEGSSSSKGKGTPFFPDAIKSYNIGSGWVEEKYPFSAMDYVLAMEGAFAMRGGAARTLGANSKRFAAFPFVFDSGEDMVDDSNEVKGTSSVLWFPLWVRRTTFDELASFITDSQARLPGKEARFSAEFVRAMNSQGVDAGFSGWQEFRFKMKGSRVPWITTGRYIVTSHNKAATHLNLALVPLDESRFMDQFEIAWKGSKADSRSPHPVRAEINSAMETAALDPTAHHCIALLESIFKASRQLAISKSFREKVHGNVTFFDKLPMNEWHELLKDLEEMTEFRIARAIASIPGLQRQHQQESRSEVQPMLGSLLPLKLGPSGWYLPRDDDRSYQAVWTGTDLCHDLATVLQRRYMDSLKDDQPGLRGVHQARLVDVMAFLKGEVDDHLIARWIEALSLIGWNFEKSDAEAKSDTEEIFAVADTAPLDLAAEGDSSSSPAIPIAYAALRTLLDLECEWQGKDRSSWKKRRSQQPISHLCQRSASSLPLAVSEALRWIGIWGVRNPWGAKSRQEKETLSGRYVVSLEHTELNLTDTLGDPARLAAAVCIPLTLQDHWQLLRAITLPFSA
ncbi:MAG: type I-U CRISPR-associated protein Csx17 [Verrucomicrobia bacterium]|nr:type I-U CRISPR-associated protein Csx17 [Verrucomicrobiota bacterium]